MNDEPQVPVDPVDAAVTGFQQMKVPEQPSDAVVLGQLRGSRAVRWYLVGGAIAASVVLAGSVMYYVWNREPARPVEDKAVAVAPAPPDIAPPSRGVGVIRGRDPGRQPPARSAEQRVANAEVIVVAMALDAAAAPDGAEHLIRYRVERVLKGELKAETIVTRTPTAAEEFLGKEWILLLSPEYIAGTHQYAETVSISAEPRMREVLAAMQAPNGTAETASTVAAGTLEARTRDAATLRGLGNALMNYAANHNQGLPNNFAVLIAAGMARPEHLVTSHSGTVPLVLTAELKADPVRLADEVARHSDYVLVGAGETWEPNPDLVIILEVPQEKNADGLLFYFGDGHVEFCRPNELVALMKPTNEYRKAKGLPEIDLATIKPTAIPGSLP